MWKSDSVRSDGEKRNQCSNAAPEESGIESSLRNFASNMRQIALSVEQISAEQISLIRIDPNDQHKVR